MATKKGIDVSQWQGEIDWQKVKKAGVEFAIIKAGYGNDATQRDKQFLANISGAKAAGIPVGVYWFSYATTVAEAKQEALACLDVIKGYTLEYPVFFDFEYASADYAKDNGVIITKALATSFALAFMQTLDKAGYYAANYTNLDYYQNYFDDAKLQNYDLWLAHYGVNKKSVDRANIWQYSETGSVDGITGKVDLNYCYVDYPTIIKKAGKNGYTATDDLANLKSAVQKRFGFSDGTVAFLAKHSNPKTLFTKLRDGGKNKTYPATNDLLTLKANVKKRFGFTDNTVKFLITHPNPTALLKKLCCKK
jgi:GH25 family lysozyme M1 (1,4-beta-N-acetylmuramidase)